jgi:hypothetical protein
MTDIFVLRRYDPPLDDERFWQMAGDALGCLQIHRVEWQHSLLSIDGRRLFCWFRAPDAESTRLALRQAGSAQAVPWAGTVHDAPGVDAPPPEAANVLVERSFEDPVTLESIQALEDAHASCLASRRVEFVRTVFSRDRKRMVCLYRAPDAEAVREAQRLAGMPVDAVWRFERKSA